MRRRAYPFARLSHLSVVVFLTVLFASSVLRTAIPQVESGTWKNAGSMSQGRRYSASALLNDGRVVISGGVSDAGTTLNSAEVFSAGDFVPAQPMAEARSHHAAVVLPDGRMLVTGGDTGGGITNSAEIYDAVAGVWTAAKPMLQARQGHTMALLSDGTVLVAGGQGPTGPVGTLEIYDPIAQDFFQVGTLANARSSHAMAVLPDGRVLIAGGMANGSDGQTAATNTAEIYDPATASLTPAASMGRPRFGCTLTTLADGTIAAIGGSDGTQDLASIEIYDPAPGTWSAASTPALAIPRSGHLAFRLTANNSVLIVGGTSAGTALASAEIYEPWSSSVRATGALSAARNGAAGSPLEAGRLLLAGGSNLATSEEYGFATLKTDKPDYSPFQKVTITGGGWQPGETVTLVLHESPAIDPDHTISAVADAFGNIYDDSFQTDAHDLDVRFLLTGRGSRFSAQIAFSDAGPLDHFQINTPSGTQTANNGFNVTVIAKDAGGSTVTAYIGTIHFTSSDTQAPVLPADYTFVVGDNGSHVFNSASQVKLKTAGTQTITATDTVDTTKTGTGSVVIAAAAVKNLVVTGFPTTTVADQAQDITVTAQDNFGNTNATYTGTVRFTSTDSQAVLPTDYTFTALDAGVHTFSAAARLRTVGTQTITATDTGTTTTNGTESGITVTPGPAATLAVTGYPSPTVAGDAHPVTVTAKDAFNNTATGYTGTVQLTSGDSQAVLPAAYIFLAADHGVHNITGTKFKTAGTQSLTATDTVTASITGTQSGIVVTAAAAKTLVVSGYPSPAIAGTSNPFTVTAQDNFGNTAAGYTGTVRFTSSDGPAVLPADYTFAAGDSGVHSFSATLKTVGTQSITAADTVTNTITGVQSGITVTPGDAASFTLSYVTTTVAGDPHQLTVTAQDAFGNTATGYLGTAHFTSSDAPAALPADYTFVAADKGTNKLGNVRLKTVGTQSITATDTVTTSITGTVSGITVTPGPAKTLAVSGYPSPATAGTSNNFTVTAQDAFGNTATGYTGIVHFTSTDGQAVLPGDYTFVAGDNGVHSGLAATLKTAATQTITATDTVTATITGTQSVTVNAAAASALTLTYPATTVAGDAHNLNVTAQDPYGNTATGYAGTVHFTSSDAQAVLPADYTFIPATDNGTHKFTTPKLKTVGTQSITATDTVAVPTITGTILGITVTPGPAKTLVVSGYPSPAIAGVSNNFTVTAQDNFGNTATGYTGTVHLTSSDAHAVLPADYTFVAGDSGVRNLNATLETAGTRNIVATDIGTATITGSQTGIVINGAAAYVLAVSGFPATATANSQHDVTVTAQDQYGNTATGYAGTVHLTSSDGQAVPPADYTFVAGDNSTHNLSVRLRTAGPQSITATDTATASITGTQTGITINAAAAKTLVLSGFPATTTANAPHDIIVTAQDNFNNTATGYTGIVHFTSTDGQATLPADYTFVPADAGVHTFSAAANLRTAGTQSITATDTVAVPAITGAESGIAVSGAAAVTLSLTFPTPVVAGDARHLTVTAKDAFSNTATGYVGTVKFTSSDAQANLPADYTFQAAEAGTHTFNVVKLKTAGTQSITGTDGTAPTITGTVAGIVVTGAAASTLAVTGYPSPATAGIANNFTVTAQDAFGNTAAGYLGIVHFTSSDATAVLPADYTFAAGDNSVHLFSATLNTVANKQSITATDTVTTTITGTQSNIRVSSGPASKLRVAGYPSPATAGVSNNFTVTAKDTNGNTVAEYTGTVHITSSDGQAVLPGDYTFAPGDVGVHTFSATLKTSGTQSITATDAATATITGTQNGITVSGGTATQLLVSGYPSPATAGVSNNFTVTLKDGFGNVATAYTGTVHFASSDAAAVLPADYAFQTTDAGVHTFSATLKTSGQQSITATDTVNALAGTQSSITVNSAGAVALLVSGYPSPATAGVSSNFTVTAKDGFGNTVTGYAGTVGFSSSDAAAALPANYTFVTGDYGVHTFSATLKTSGTQAISATDSVNSSITGTQNNITVGGGAATQLLVSGYPSPATAGVSNNFTVTLKDGFGNVATAYTGTVHFASSDGQAVLPANYTFATGDAGVHTFSATLKTSGTQSITATDTVNALAGTQSSITVNSAGAVALLVSGYPSPATAGVSSNFTVTMKDGFGNVATAYTGTVHFASSDAAAVLPADYTFQTTDAGVRIFSATLKTSGTQSITGTDTVNALAGTQSSITVNSAGAVALLVSGYPSPATAGVSSNFTVTLKDGFGNVATAYTGTVHFASSDGQAVLPANYTFATGDAGVHTFSATLKTSGTQSITATDTVNALAGTQSSITVSSAGAVALLVSGYPSPATAGVSNNFTVTLKDGFGNVATGYSGTVHFTSSDAQAILPGNYTFQAVDAGVHTFSATLKTSGTQSITATDTVNGTITGTQSNITVGGGSATLLVVSGFPSPATAGASNSFTVTAKDGSGNVATAYTGTVHFTSSDGQAILPANYTFQAGEAGVHTFSATLKTSGTQSITATDTVTAAITGAQSGITVGGGAATQLLVSGYPSPATAGVSNNFTVTAKDGSGNVATTYTGTVRFTSSDGQAILPAEYAFQAGEAGVHTFSATLKTSGTQSITATDTVNGTITGTQSNITVGGGSATLLVVSGFPSPATAGASNSFTVTAKDGSGNVATAYTGTVHFTSSDGQAILPANYTFQAGEAGVHTFSATLKTSGTQAISATDTGNGSITGTQSAITVNSAGAAALLVSGYPSPATAGVSNNFTVTAKDGSGNVATAYTGTVRFTSSDGQAILPANYTFQAGEAGVHTFSATLKTSGTQSITATDTVTAAITGAQSGITVGGGAATQLLVSGYPSPATAGVSNNFTVTAKDGSGNVATTYTGTVRFTSSDGQAILPAEYAFQAGEAGVHTFSATLKTSGTQSITATDTVNGTITGTQSNITVGGGSATLLVVSGFPSPATAGASNSFTVTAKDGSGNVATAYTGTVHFTSSDGQAILPANYTFQAGEAGVHTFSATLKTSGTQAISATDTGNGSITGTQSAITVNSAGAAALLVSGYPSPATAGVSNNFTVTAKDGSGNVATAYTGTVRFTSSDGQAILPANYTFVAGDSGTHTFSATLKTAGSQSITGTDTGNGTITGTQSAITVNSAGAAVLLVSGYPASTTPGASHTFSVTAKDAFGNTAIGYTGTVGFSSSDVAATLPGNYTFVSGDTGSHLFSATLQTAGVQSITATDVAVSSITGSQTGITVNSSVDTTPPTVTPASLSFPNTAVGFTSTTTKSVTVKNVRTTPMTVTSVISGDFVRTGTTCGVLQPGLSCTITVAFAPTDASARTGTLSVKSDSVPNSIDVPLSGTGLVPVKPTPANLAFGAWPLGELSTALTVAIKNNQPRPLNILGTAVSDPQFQVSNPCTSPIPSGQTCSVSVKFLPTTTVKTTATLTITDDSNAGVELVSLNGKGTAPVTFSPANVSFPRTDVGTSSDSVFVTMTNNLDTRLTITSITISGDFIKSGCAITSLASGASCTLTLHFKPTIGGVRTGALTAVHGAVTSPQTIPLSGTGTNPVVLSVGSLAFSSTPVGTTSARQGVVVRNQQSIPLTTTGITTTGDFAASGCESGIAANSSCTVWVTFTPTAKGTRPGTLTITDDASNSPQTVKLTGKGS